MYMNLENYKMTWTNIINKIDTEKRDWAKQATKHCIDFDCPYEFDKAMENLKNAK